MQDLGIPTANVCLDKNTLQCTMDDYDSLPTGIYWGFARIGESSNNNDSVLGKVHTAAISIGYNPTYNNTEKTVEPHLIAHSEHPQRHASSSQESQFQDFYEKVIVLSVVGFLRPELPFEGLSKLVNAIKRDIVDSIRLSESDEPMVMAENEWVATAIDL